MFNVHVCLQGGYIPSLLSGTPLYMTIIAVFLLTKISSALGQAIDPFAIIERLLFLHYSKSLFPFSSISSLILVGQDSMEDVMKETPPVEEEEEAIEGEAVEEDEETEKDEDDKKNE